MQAVLEPYMVKMTSPEESNQYSSGARGEKIRSWDAWMVYHADRLAQTWGTCVKGAELGFRL